MNSLTSLQTLVLPNLDYCSCVWDPHLKTSTQVEAVQSFAAKLSTKRWSDSYESLLSRLDWEPLTSRHSRQKLLLCHRILLGSSLISPPTPILTLNITLVPFAQTVTFQNSFFVSVASLWNNFLPDSVISVRSLFSL